MAAVTAANGKSSGGAKSADFTAVEIGEALSPTASLFHSPKLNCCIIAVLGSKTVKTRDAESLFVFKIHHSIGDGASLISLLLACARKSSDPNALPSVPVKNRRARRQGVVSASGFCWSLVWLIWAVVRLVWNTLVDVLLVNATVLFLRDTRTPIKGPATGEGRNGKRFVHRTVSLGDIKMVKNAMNMLIGENQKNEEKQSNQIQKSYLPSTIRLRACIMVNMRPTTGIQDMAKLMAKGPKAKWGWGNWIGNMMIPLTIALRDDPLDYLWSAKATMDRKKHSLEPILEFIGARILPMVFGVKATVGIFHKILSNTTLAFSNVVGPVEEISLYGHPIAYIAPSVYGHPHVSAPLNTMKSTYQT
ncbi:unnamed protein product [Linum tenue]|uniref:O-acyltransferase WSD1 C-terminal domain-containing protein n=1 Tax=Linum tenue TaxID=586396 RepID=A0AAV0QAD9_9ROSI|nr:unnamed protein product [Linum tenue]